MAPQVWSKCVDGTLDFCRELVANLKENPPYDLILSQAVTRKSPVHARWALEQGAQLREGITKANVGFMELVDHPSLALAIQTYYQMKRREDDLITWMIIASLIQSMGADDDD